MTSRPASVSPTRQPSDKTAVSPAELKRERSDEADDQQHHHLGTDNAATTAVASESDARQTHHQHNGVESDHTKKLAKLDTELAKSKDSNNVARGSATPARDQKLSTEKKAGRKSSAGNTPASVKRAVAGVASKKSGQSLVTRQNYKTGDLVFARVKGHPFWPAKIIDLAMVPKTHTKGKALLKGYHAVIFYSSHEYSFLSAEDLCPFAENVEVLGRVVAKEEFKHAIQLITENPNYIDEVVKEGLKDWNRLSGRLNNIQLDDDDEENDDRDKHNESRPSSGGTYREKKSNNSAKSTTKKRLVKGQPDDETEGRTRKSRKSAVGETTDTNKHTAKKSKRSENASTKEETTNDSVIKKESKAAPAAEQLKKMRYVLQRTFIRDKNRRPLAHPDTVSQVEWAKVLATLDNVREYAQSPEFDYTAFTDNKLPKVVRMIRVDNFDPSMQAMFKEHGIDEKLAEMIDAVKNIVVPASAAGRHDTNTTTPGDVKTPTTNPTGESTNEDVKDMEVDPTDV